MDDTGGRKFPLATENENYLSFDESFDNFTIQVFLHIISLAENILTTI